MGNVCFMTSKLSLGNGVPISFLCVCNEEKNDIAVCYPAFPFYKTGFAELFLS